MNKTNEGLTKKQARVVERTIVGFSILSLVFLFQPFSMTLYAIGCVAVVIGGLAFNLVPLCVEGVKSSQLIKIGLITSKPGVPTSLRLYKYICFSKSIEPDVLIFK